MQYDVVALGELLVDFTGNGNSALGNPLFEANPGGAPCNVLAMLARYGHKTAFIGKVGADMFGHLLQNAIREAGIGDSGLVLDAAADTTLAFVHTAPDGDRDFSFYRNPGADTQLRPEEVDDTLLQSCKIFHFGSLSLTHEPAAAATRRAVETAQAAGALVSFDPNLRPLLWRDLAAARRAMEWGCGQCDILKLSEEELEFLSPGETPEAQVGALRGKYPNLRLLLVTKGKAGSACFCGALAASCPTFLNVKTIDTTGAGDTFLGACLHFVLLQGLDGLDAMGLEQMLLQASAASSLVTTKKGALRSMPTPPEIEALIAGDV